MKQIAYLLLDLGNSRIKWRHSASGCSGVAHSCSELWQQVADLPAGAQILGCAVGAADLQQQIDQLFTQHWQVLPQWLQVTRQALGIMNHYPQLNEQGPDRWAAVLGAHQHYPQQNLLVISAGTAMVIDTLLANGDYLGGSIAPGLGLMKSALHQATARLPHARGTLQAFPQSTLDAIETGCLRAIIGSVEQALSAAIAHGHPIDQVIVFGGDAAYLQPLLHAKAIAMDNLVLDGLAALLAAGDGKLNP